MSGRWPARTPQLIWGHVPDVIELTTRAAQPGTLTEGPANRRTFNHLHGTTRVIAARLILEPVQEFAGELTPAVVACCRPVTAGRTRPCLSSAITVTWRGYPHNRTGHIGSAPTGREESHGSGLHEPTPLPCSRASFPALFSWTFREDLH